MQELTPEQIEQLEDLLYQGVRLRTEADVGAPPAVETAHAWKKLDAYKTLPEWFGADALQGVTGYVHPRYQLELLLEASAALSYLADYQTRIRWNFYRKTKTSKGARVWGQAKKIGSKEACLLGGRFWWDIDLSLSAWALLDPPGRLRLLHHECSHLAVELDDKGEVTPGIRTHDVEAFLGTLAELGPVHSGETAFLVAGAARPETRDAARSPLHAERMRQAGLAFKPLDVLATDGGVVAVTSHQHDLFDSAAPEADYTQDGRPLVKGSEE